jgi:hypothetical protein
MIQMNVVIPFVFAIGGLAGLIWSIVIIFRSIDSESWKWVDCHITESTIKVISGEGTEYRAIVKYQYSVDGIPYEGDTVRFGRSSAWKSTAEKICKKYPKGVTARVSYNPENPQSSVLIPGISPSIYVIVFLSICFLILGIYGVLAA